MTANSRDLHLSILDQTMLRQYVRNLLIFPFPDPSHTEAATNALRTGFSATLHQFPFLAGTIKQSDSPSTRLSLQYPEHIPPELVSRIFNSDFDLAANLIFHYDTLREGGMPPSRLPSDVFCPKVLRSHPGLDDPCAEGITSFAKGYPIPVIAAQANFIPGGLILSVYTHHSVVDGTGIARLYQVWSGHIRSHNCDEETPDSQHPSSMSPTPTQNNYTDPSLARRTIDTFATPPSFAECPEVRIPGTSASVPALRSTPYNLSAKVIVFTESKISSLSATLSAITNKRISAFIVLAAMLWSHITRARGPLLAEHDIQKTTLGIAIDHRKNLGPAITHSYLGNCATGLTTSLPLSTILSPLTITAESLAPVAVNISQSLSSVDLDWLKARISYFSRTPNSSALSLDLDIRNGPDLFITSWMHMGADYEWGIPGTMESGDGKSRRGGVPTAIRKPHWASEGSIIVLPRQKIGSHDFEVSVCLEEAEMGKVVESLRREMWVERIIDA
ncbi:hypothetical protein K505DRAFT_327196 [Melanomma pulvis-pyrius CBS 109.77]|uniref:Uncharacterized protein n=1 Tax=Melanomma pulvis-pyrius CBS 109.77 TaxID=1314802 RepID=A0A6A6X503_9PLEO|nr:hypothetical protein K505DRAFT_327196 [Melanomma pulvis-pyrius CBS 109.77]